METSAYQSFFLFLEDLRGDPESWDDWDLMFGDVDWADFLVASGVWYLREDLVRGTFSAADELLVILLWLGTEGDELELLAEGLLGLRVVVTRPLDLLRVALRTEESKVLSSDDTGGFTKSTERSLLLFRLEPSVLLMGFCKRSDFLEPTVPLLLLELMWSGSGRDLVLRLAWEDWLKSLESDVVPLASVSLLLLLDALNDDLLMWK